MFFYTNIGIAGNNVLFRGYKDGKKITQKVQYSPSLFIESKSGEFKSLVGDICLERKQFDTIKDLKDFKMEMGDLSNVRLYGTTNIKTQFTNEYFDGPIDYDLSLMTILSIDIETKTEHGRIDTTNTPEEITLITLKDFITKEIVTLGCWDFVFDKDRIEQILKDQDANIDLNRLSKFKYIQCANENELLKSFIDIISNNYPDIITGYNVEMFDIPYITNRIRLKLGEKYAKKLSPWGNVYDKMVRITVDREELSVKWDGVSILDYMDLYHTFSYKKLENKKLDTVAFEELKRRKLSHEYNTFREFYEKDPYKFTLYNIIDTDIIDELEEKMQLIHLVISVAYEAKTNYNDVLSRIATWESIIYNILMSHKVVPALKTSNESSSGILGAYVKDIEPCLKEWDVAFDATSLYPSIIMALNMSPETLVEDCELFPSTSESILNLVERKIDLDHLKKSKNSIAANGQQFTTATKGWFPIIVEHFFDQRQISKKSMLKLESEHSKDIEILKQISSLNIKQMAFKILLNSLYGAMGNEHFTYFDTRIAEGITMTGQLIIRNAEVGVNKFLCGLLKVQEDYCYYCDTDSMHISLNNLVKKYYSNKTPREISHILSTICKDVLSPEIDKICDNLDDYINSHQRGKISFKREFIASRGIYTAKKRYCLYVYNSEGVEYDPPKPKIMGLEIVRSSTPNVVRNSLKEAVVIILSKDNQDLIDFVEKFKANWYNLSHDVIAFPRSVNNILKYSDSAQIFKKGSPVHVKAVLIYNNLLKKNNIDHYEYIKDGDRMKWVYLVEPNKFSNNGLAFIDKIPEEFDAVRYVDYEKMLSKTFLEPLMKITNAIGWEVQLKADLGDLFS